MRTYEIKLLHLFCFNWQKHFIFLCLSHLLQQKKRIDVVGSLEDRICLCCAVSFYTTNLLVSMAECKTKNRWKSGISVEYLHRTTSSNAVLFVTCRLMILIRISNKNYFSKYNVSIIINLTRINFSHPGYSSITNSGELEANLRDVMTLC